MNSRCLLLALLITLPALSEASSTHRCGRHLISLGASAIEIQDKCGTPAYRDLIGEQERLDDYGYRQLLVVEEWVYGPSNGMYYTLRLEGGRLVRISSRRR